MMAQAAVLRAHNRAQAKVNNLPKIYRLRV